MTLKDLRKPMAPSRADQALRKFNALLAELVADGAPLCVAMLQTPFTCPATSP